MRILVISIGSLGDTLPFVAWAKALEARGHEVILGMNGYYHELLDREGVRYEALWSADEHAQVIAQSQVWQKSTPVHLGKDWFTTLLPRVYDFVIRNHLGGQTVVAAQGELCGARVAQETHDIPLATIHMQPTLLRSIHDSTGPVERWPMWMRRGLDRFVDILVDRWLGKPLNAFRRSFGLSPVKRTMKYWWNSPQMVINFFPRWFNPPQPDWPPNSVEVGFPFFRDQRAEFDRAGLEAFLSAGEAPMVFSVSSFTNDAKQFFESSLAGAMQLGRRAIFLTPYAEQIPATLPPEVRHFKFVPLEAVLPRAVIHIHHAGIGTIAWTIDAGIPHVSVPQGLDQHDSAARLDRLGISRTIKPKEYNSDRLVTACRELLQSDEVSRRCRELAALSHRQDALAEASAALEELLDRSRSTPAPVASR